MFDLTPTSTPLQIAARRHRAQDRLLRRTYGQEYGEEGFRGCSVGCLAFDVAPELLHRGEGGYRTHWVSSANLHRIVAQAYGYPEWLARLQDAVFERLPYGDHKDWHVDLADAIAARTRDWTRVEHAVLGAVLRLGPEVEWAAADAVAEALDLHDLGARGEPVEPVAPTERLRLEALNPYERELEIVFARGPRTASELMADAALVSLADLNESAAAYRAKWTATDVVMASVRGRLQSGVSTAGTERLWGRVRDVALTELTRA